jgi:hypothetical protein
MRRFSCVLIALVLFGCLPSDVDLVPGSTTLHCTGGYESFDVLLDWDEEGRTIFRLLNYDGYSGVDAHWYDFFVGSDYPTFTNINPNPELTTGKIKFLLKESGIDHIMHFRIRSDYEGEVDNSSSSRTLDIALLGGSYVTQLEVESSRDPLTGRPFYKTAWLNGGTCVPL